MAGTWVDHLLREVPPRLHDAACVRGRTMVKSAPEQGGRA